MAHHSEQKVPVNIPALLCELSSTIHPVNTAVIQSFECRDQVASFRLKRGQGNEFDKAVELTGIYLTLWKPPGAPGVEIKVVREP